MKPKSFHGKVGKSASLLGLSDSGFAKRERIQRSRMRNTPKRHTVQVKNTLKRHKTFRLHNEYDPTEDDQMERQRNYLSL